MDATRGDDAALGARSSPVRSIQVAVDRAALDDGVDTVVRSRVHPRNNSLERRIIWALDRSSSIYTRAAAQEGSFGRWIVAAVCIAIAHPSSPLTGDTLVYW